MVAIRLPGPLRRLADGQSKVEVDGTTVGEALESLVSSHPELKPHVFADDGALQEFVNFFVGSEDIRGLKGKDTPVEADDAILVLPAVAGGGL